MSAREEILASIKTNQPALNALPEIDIKAMIQYDDLLIQFKLVLESIGGKLMEVKDNDALQILIQSLSNSKANIVNAVDPDELLKKDLALTPLEQLALIDIAFIRGSFGVAENGAVWVDENQMAIRILPFICEQLVIVMNRSALVANMGDAYSKVNGFENGFGVFIAGPSKTADIEQSLVIGAHGPKQSVVILVG
jgi:L-lactate dehydrogenase complex protein LldG